jgi:hypothetical protein
MAARAMETYLHTSSRPNRHITALVKRYLLLPGAGVLFRYDVIQNPAA